MSSSAADLTPNANQKIIQYLNDALAMENAAEDRIQSRLQETIVDDTRMQLQDHLDETRSQKDRLKQIITSHGGEPTDAKADLPILIPNTIDLVRNDLRSWSPDQSANNAGLPDSQGNPSVKSIVKYKMLMEIAKKVGAMDAIPVIDQNLKEDEQMANWIIANMPNMLRKVWAQIEVSAGARTIPEA